MQCVAACQRQRGKRQLCTAVHTRTCYICTSMCERRGALDPMPMRLVNIVRSRKLLQATPHVRILHFTFSAGKVQFRGIWFGLYWVFSSFFFHYIHSKFRGSLVLALRRYSSARSSSVASVKQTPMECVTKRACAKQLKQVYTVVKRLL